MNRLGREWNFNPILKGLVVQCIGKLRLKPCPDMLNKMRRGVVVRGVFEKLRAQWKNLFLKMGVKLKLMLFRPSQQRNDTKRYDEPLFDEAKLLNVLNG